MATEYRFVDVSNTLDSSETAVWEQEHSNDHYSDAVDVTLTEETSQNYDSVNDSDNEATQYFSILDNTGEISLHDITTTALNSGELEISEQQNLVADADMSDATNTIDMGGQQVILFRIDGSDDLYGLQVTQDDEGNLQKFQFKVRLVKQLSTLK